MNPLSALAEFVLGRMKQAMVGAWLKLLFEMAFSATVSFLFVCGTALVAGAGAGVAVGAGMVMSAMAMTLLFRRSTLTKGLMVALPATEAAKELETQFQTIERK